MKNGISISTTLRAKPINIQLILSVFIFFPTIIEYITTAGESEWTSIILYYKDERVGN